MSFPQEPFAEQSGPIGSGSFSLRAAAIWLPGTVILGLLVARAADDAQNYFAPLVLFPLLTGIGLGGLLIGLMRMGQIGHRPTIIFGTLLAVLTAVSGQHYFSYLSARQSAPDESLALEKVKKVIPEFTAEHLPAHPADFMEYMHQQAIHGRPLLFDYSARGLLAWLSWIIDALIVLGGASAVVVPAMLLPFCDRCRTWYRAIRNVHIPASVIRQIGLLVGVETVEHLKSGSCRLICCQRGCGPTGCELSWEDAAGDTFFARVWLDADNRNQIMQMLDQIIQA